VKSEIDVILQMLYGAFALVISCRNYNPGSPREILYDIL
jgi:hypothetical protein